MVQTGQSVSYMCLQLNSCTAFLSLLCQQQQPGSVLLVEDAVLLRQGRLHAHSERLKMCIVDSQKIYVGMLVKVLDGRFGKGLSTLPNEALKINEASCLTETIFPLALASSTQRLWRHSLSMTGRAESISKVALHYSIKKCSKRGVCGRQ